MKQYFERLENGDGRAFSTGLGWMDRTGILRVSTNPGTVQRRLDVSDRSYFQHVLASGQPYVSEGITSREDGMRVIVMAVPTKDARGRVTGVLAAALLRRPFAITKGSLDLGDPGVAVLDRHGRSVLDNADPSNAALVASLHGTGSLPDTLGLDGSDGHAIAYTTSAIPSWTIVVDQPRADLFADARRGLILELALVARRGVDRALPDRLHPAARPPRRRARAHARTAAPRPQPRPQQRVARQRGLERPRRRALGGVPRCPLRRRAGRRGSPRPGAQGIRRGCVPLDAGRARPRRPAGGGAGTRVGHGDRDRQGLRTCARRCRACTRRSSKRRTPSTRRPS